MATITVVGLGPGAPELLTVEARAALAGRRVYLRTRDHAALADFPASTDWFAFDEAATPDQVAARLIEDAREAPLVYAVPGHPLFGDATVGALLRRADDAGLPVRVIPGLSPLDAALPALGVDAVAGSLQVVDALALAAALERAPFEGGSLPVSPLRPALVLHTRSSRLGGAAARALAILYPADAPVDVVRYRTGSATVSRIRLDAVLDAEDTGDAWYLPAVDPLAHGRTAEALQQIVARLRAPGGCPWDREQTHQSLKRHLIEEAYEALDAIERGDPREMEEELGDLLLQVFLHAQLAQEAGTFRLEDVYETLSAKLVRRHPHVFGDTVAETAGAVLQRWDEIKRAERVAKGTADESSPLGRVPSHLPALARAQTLLRRARRQGVDPSIDAGRPALRAILASEGTPPAGDVAAALAYLADLAARSGVDAEDALRGWTLEFERWASAALSDRERSDPARSGEDADTRL